MFATISRRVLDVKLLLTNPTLVKYVAIVLLKA